MNLKSKIQILVIHSSDKKYSTLPFVFVKTSFVEQSFVRNFFLHEKINLTISLVVPLILTDP